MSDAVEIELVRSLAIGIPSIVAAIFSYLGLRQSRSNHVTMNSRMDEMLHMRGVASEAIGEKRERDKRESGGGI